MSTTAILLVTWIVSGMAPSSYQTPFSTMATCEEAKNKILAEREKLVAEENDYVATIRKQGVIQLPRNIAVTAICTAQ
jgi:hypothetical protein